jgi:hypothetical protein
MNIWRRKAFFPQDQHRLSSACDNRLPFWDPCPCASTTGLGNDSAAFDRQGRLRPFCDGTLYQDHSIRWQFAPSHSLLFAATTAPVRIIPNSLRIPITVIFTHVARKAARNDRCCILSKNVGRPWSRQTHGNKIQHLPDQEPTWLTETLATCVHGPTTLFQTCV